MCHILIFASASLFVRSFLAAAPQTSEAANAHHRRVQPFNGTHLKFVVTSSRLPAPSYFHTQPVYDGDDSVYIVGGYNSTIYFAHITRYSLSTGQVTVIGAFDEGVYEGAAFMDMDNEHIIRLGGFGDASGRISDIHRISTIDGASSRVNTSLPEPITAFHAAWDRSRGVAYLFGGYGASAPLRSILMYNASNSNDNDNDRLTEVGQLPEARFYAGTVWDDERELAYIFGGGGGETSTNMDILTFDPATRTVTKLPEKLPFSMSYPTAVYAKDYDYGSGGRTLIYVYDVGARSGLVTFDPEDNIVPEGVHNFPYPGGNCTLYIRCFDGIGQTLSCAPLLFDSIDLVCKPPSQAVCDEQIPINCPPEGYYPIPHPASCSKYYECIEGSAYESECAPSTYFDTTPELSRCNLAELALCNAECPPTGSAFLPIRARDCKWYKVCVEGHSINLECGRGEVYGPEEAKCVQEDAYACPYATVAVLEDWADEP